MGLWVVHGKSAGLWMQSVGRETQRCLYGMVFSGGVFGLI